MNGRRHRIAGALLAIIVAAASPAAAQTLECGDLDGSGSVAASDALRLLNAAIGLPVTLMCPAGATTTTTTTTTVPGGGCDPGDPSAYDSAPEIGYQCPALGLDLSISHWVFSTFGDGMAATALPGVIVSLIGNNPVCPGGAFSLTGFDIGDCQVDYELSATYTTADSWTGTFDITLTGAACAATGCSDASFNIVGSR